MANTDSRWNTRNRVGWRWLGVFWLAVLSLMAIGTGVVQWLGPPEPAPREAALSPANPPAPPIGTNLVANTPPGLVAPAVAGRDTPGPVADPDPDLLEALGDGSTASLPRIGINARTPMRVYAAGFDHSSRRPRVGLLLAGIGPNEVESDAAIRALPGAVSLAVSPYAANLTRLLATARTGGHEYLIAVPLEPAGFPLSDPGPQTLLTSATAATNAQYLRWALSRINGYVGATGVIGTMRGERLAAMSDQMDAVLSELAERGLLYVDPREARAPIGKTWGTKTWGRNVDVVIDNPSDLADHATIDAKLAELEQRAKDTGSALGLVMRPTPVAVERIAVWSSGLTDRGLALAPVSALVLPPSDVPVKLSEREP